MAWGNRLLIPLLLLQPCFVLWAVAGSPSFIHGRGCGVSKEISTVKTVHDDNDLTQMECTLVEVTPQFYNVQTLTLTCVLEKTPK